MNEHSRSRNRSSISSSQRQTRRQWIATVRDFFVDVRQPLPVAPIPSPSFLLVLILRKGCPGVIAAGRRGFMRLRAGETRTITRCLSRSCRTPAVLRTGGRHCSSSGATSRTVVPTPDCYLLSPPSYHRLRISEIYPLLDPGHLLPLSRARRSRWERMSNNFPHVAGRARE